MSEKSCWIILPKKVNSQYRSETLLKQISLHMFLNYCTNVLVVGFVYFLRNLSRRISSELKAFCKKKMFLKDFRIQRKTLVSESSIKVAGCFKKETLAQVFYCKFHRIFKKRFVCFVEPHHCLSKNQLFLIVSA